MKYKLSDIKHRILHLENPNYQEHKNYLTALIDRSATEWTFPSWMGISTIGFSAFEGFRNLTNITIPDSVTKIGTCAFYGCWSLTNLSIPDSVTMIYGDAFTACNNLTDMYLYPTTPPTLVSTSAISKATTTIHVPIGSGDAYKTATNWSSFADKIVEDIEI